ncbi:MAG: HIT family protein [Bacteroidetes bacterium]|nr:MAG: HIT family protein [Bacteroidota bacterium]
MTLFSKIIAGDIPSFKIAESALFLAFLDINPAADGHTLVVPKVEIDAIFDLPVSYLAEILPFCQPIAAAIKQAVGCNRVNLLTIGFEVPHAHIHLIPMNGMQDAQVLAKKNKPSPAELAAMQQKILQYL